MKESLLLFNLKLNCLIFSTNLNSSLIIFIQTYTVNYQNALDRLCVRMNIILFDKFLQSRNPKIETWPIPGFGIGEKGWDPGITNTNPNKQI